MQRGDRACSITYHPDCHAERHRTTIERVGTRWSAHDDAPNVVARELQYACQWTMEVSVALSEDHSR